MSVSVDSSLNADVVRAARLFRRLKDAGNLIKKQDLVSDVLCDYFINIVKEVGDKNELRENKTDLSKHSSIQSIINHSNNVEDIGLDKKGQQQPI